LDSEDTPDWLEDWPTFLETLRNQFGPIDPAADAEDTLDHLKMRDNQRIVKYNVDFNRLAIQTGWGDSVLRHRYYSGLAEWIKDNMGHLGKPPTLDEMKKLAHSIDSRHWERLREKSRSEKSAPTKSDKPSNSNNSQTNNSNNNSNKKPQHSTSDSNKSNKSTPSTNNSAKSDISDKLKDGKLTAQERKRRLDNDLCMYCGGVGHKAKDCAKSTSSAAKAKGRAAQAQPTTATATTSAPTQGKD
jgi:Mg-chelatase subunit ChlI